MTDMKIRLITGAGRGMGVDIAKAALAAGHAVVGTGRDPGAVTMAVGASEDLLAVKLDVNSPADAKAATQAAVERFGRIESTRYAEPSIDDYAEKTKQTIAAWDGMNGQQGGDPAKLAQALVTIASEEGPARRFIAGADAIATAEQVVANLQAQIDAYRDLSSALALDAA